MTMEHLNLIRKIVWSFHKRTGLDWDELFQEAYIEYLNLSKKYDPKKSKVSTFLWMDITNCLINYLNKETRINQPIVDIEETALIYEPAHNPPPYWENLDEDGKKIADLVLKYSQHFVCLTPEEAQQRVVNILYHKGWPLSKIYSGLDNLKLAFSN